MKCGGHLIDLGLFFEGFHVSAAGHLPVVCRERHPWLGVSAIFSLRDEIGLDSVLELQRA